MLSFIYLFILIIAVIILASLTINIDCPVSNAFTGWAFIVSFIGLICLVYNIKYKLEPINSDIDKVEKLLHNYEINNYFQKFCKNINDTEYSDELKVMQVTNKNNEEIWEFCNEKLKDSSIYEEMKNDKEVKNINKSLSILIAKREPFSKRSHIIFFSSIGLAIAPFIIALIFACCDLSYMNRNSDKKRRKEKITDFLAKVNS